MSIRLWDCTANRIEFLIKANTTPGIYRIAQQAQNQQFIESAQKIVAEIEVKGFPKICLCRRRFRLRNVTIR